jgi:MEMO1 family protein
MSVSPYYGHTSKEVGGNMPSNRPPAVAGLFYPEHSGILAGEVRAMLDNANKFTPISAKALIVPHAGYIYSGPVAASAYAVLKDRAHSIRRVILLGPTHRIAVRGLALPGADTFQTPLGEVPIDLDAAGLIAHLPQVCVSPQAHAQEHSLEVQLPFLQTVLDNFKVLPLAVGMATPEEVSEVLELLWGGDETLIVISSDLSHYLPYEVAKRVDSASIQSIVAGRELSHEQACGATPINGLVLAAHRHYLSPRLLDLRNSGDTAGPRDGVVGYAALAFVTGDQK